MLNIVTYKWGSKFTREHVEILFAMCKRYIKCDFRFFSFEDDKIFEHTFTDTDRIVSKTGDSFYQANSFPKCYRRLWLYSQDSKNFWSRNSKVLLLDLDIAITGDITDLVLTDAPFAYYNKNHVRYQGAFQLTTPGLYSYVWDDFIKDPAKAIADTKSKGSDQGWISTVIPEGEKVYTEKDGFLLYDMHCYNKQFLEPDTKIVFFRARFKPWLLLQYHEWLREYYKI